MIKKIVVNININIYYNIIIIIIIIIQRIIYILKPYIIFRDKFQVVITFL